MEAQQQQPANIGSGQEEEEDISWLVAYVGEYPASPPLLSSSSTYWEGASIFRGDIYSS